jgi:lipid-binding SYLF domain-containing protein
VRDDTNAAYYGRRVSPNDILEGRVKVPKGAERLRKALGRY